MRPTSRNRVQFIPIHLTLARQPINVRVHSVFSSSLNFVWEGSLYTISSHLSPGIHSIGLTQPVNFNDWVTDQTVITIDASSLSIDLLYFPIPLASKVEIHPHQTIYSLSSTHHRLLNELEQRLKEEGTLSVFSFDLTDKIISHQMQRIQLFLDDPSPTHALGILGLGQGLTPLGDDILFGHMMAMNCFDSDMEYIQEIQSHLHQTVSISAQLLTDVAQRHYSLMYVEFLDALFHNHSWKHIDTILSFGSSSGAGILTGFLYGLKKEITSERIQTV
jgi:hypothetical protein